MMNMVVIMRKVFLWLCFFLYVLVLKLGLKIHGKVSVFDAIVNFTL